MRKADESGESADALMLFGASGDLAHKMIFPALYAMVKRDALAIPVIGVACSKWDLDKLQASPASRTRRKGSTTRLPSTG
jgi:glucose-6-phosphate 1-dehydrogenase